jgi:ATP-dependent Lhr-like helicase
MPGSRLLAVSRPGTIPDRGLFRVEREETRERLGELDEEFVFETRVGDVFVLGATAWRVARITRDSRRGAAGGARRAGAYAFLARRGAGAHGRPGPRRRSLTREIAVCSTVRAWPPPRSWCRASCVARHRRPAASSSTWPGSGRAAPRFPTTAPVAVEL